MLQFEKIHFGENMKKFNLFICILALLFIPWLAHALSPVGNWLSLDDQTHQPRCVIKIWQEGDHYFGKVYKVWLQPGEKEGDVCVLCKGELHNQPMLGLKILRGFNQVSANKWAHGTIVDPTTGGEYHSTLTLNEDGNQLFVRGYIGVPLFGRTQTWYREGTF